MSHVTLAKVWHSAIQESCAFINLKLRRILDAGLLLRSHVAVLELIF